MLGVPTGPRAKVRCVKIIAGFRCVSRVAGGGVTEALLEAYYFDALRNQILARFPGSRLRFFKPSPQEERWVGFDQGWSETDLPQPEFLDRLRGAIAAPPGRLDRIYIAYFLQFKRAERLVRGSRLRPAGIQTPYIRFELSLAPDAISGLSQHETLLRLSRNTTFPVDYACPMLFDPPDIRKPARIEDVRFVPLSEAPGGWATNQRHFLVFQTAGDNAPLWASDVKKGTAEGFQSWFSESRHRSVRPLGGEEVAGLVDQTWKTLLGEIPERIRKRRGFEEDHVVVRALPDGMTIVEIDRG